MKKKRSIANAAGERQQGVGAGVGKKKNCRDVVLLLSAASVCACYGGSEDSSDTDGSGSMGSASTSEVSQGDDGSDTSDSTPEPEDVPEDSVPQPLIARLNHVQYANIMADIFGVALTDAELELIPNDISVGSGYSTRVLGQFFNAQYVLGYASVGRSVVARVGPEQLSLDHGECPLGEATCLERLVDGLGLRVHRRPLTTAQRSSYLELADSVLEQPDAGIGDAVVAVAEAMSQSPHFLYRVEEEVFGEPDLIYQADAYEIASRIALFLWQSTPDDTLLTFAAEASQAGVVDDTQLEAQITRMMLDSRFSRSRRQFWSDYTQVTVAGFSSSDPDVAVELRDSLVATLERVSGADGPAQALDALFVGDELLMTPAVAELAGAQPQGDGLQLYNTSEAQMRQGVLTHPGFLAALGTTSFVGRGLFLSERLLCQHILPPPSDEGTATAIMETAMQTESLTPREASEFRFGLEPVCLTCHTQFEPIAYAFERYDMEGRYTTTDDEGRALYSDGRLPAFLERPEILFDDAAQLFSGLAQADATYRCMVENMMEYATGWPSGAAEDALDTGLESFSEQGNTFDGLVRSVAQSQQITLKRSATQE